MKSLLVSAALLSALSCSDSSAPEVSGSVTFAYTGAGGGTFSASGNAPSLTAPPPTETSWAAGYVQADNSFLAGSTPQSGGLVDLAVLRIGRTTPGSESIDPACNIDGSASCTGMELYLNFNGDGDTGDFFCALTSGTIVLTEASSSRARGTFSGGGSCTAGTGGSPSTFSVTGGTFDVALVAHPV